MVVWGPLIRRRVRQMNRVAKQTEDIVQHVFAELFRVRVIDKFLASPRFDEKTALGFRGYTCAPRCTTSFATGVAPGTAVTARSRPHGGGS